jgi:NAD(P)-dependent dehydrogenase (short-subunit alcohol dehydrogenase family)
MLGETGWGMDLGLIGKRAIVTGASRGIGLAVARGLAAEGATVVMVARGEDDLAAAARTVDGATITVAADTTDDASVRAMVERVVAELGGVDVLVNAAAQPAGGGPVPPLAELPDAAVQADFDTKVLGYLRTARAVAPHMTSQGWGRIVNISGLNARRTGSISGAIRNVAVAALTANLADELGPHGVNVTVVHPGMTITERSPATFARMGEASGRTADEVERATGAGTAIGRVPTAEEVAWVITFLASPRSVTMTGDPVVVSGGAPGPIYY